MLTETEDDNYDIQKVLSHTNDEPIEGKMPKLLGKQVIANFPQYFGYARTPQLELWAIKLTYQ